jgi:hypothetical protein
VSAERRRKIATTFAARVRLPLTSEADGDVADKLVRRRRYHHLGWTAGIAVSIPLAPVDTEGHAFYLMPGFAVLAVVLAGTAIGPAVAHVRKLRGRRSPEAARVAHVRSTILTDCVGPLELCVARVSALLPAVLTAAYLLTPHRPVADVQPRTTANPVVMATLSAAAIGLLVAVEIAARAILRAPQPAGTGEALVLDDALRAQALRDLLFLPVLLPIIPTVGMAELIRDTSRWQAVSGLSESLPLWLIMIPVLAWLIFTRSERTRFQKRLWPVGDRVPVDSA